MSGIVGILNLDGAPVDVALLERMTQATAFRGPDGQAIWLQGQIGLGQALMRTGEQDPKQAGPRSLDGQVWITADVRLDDREGLIRQLQALNENVTAETPDPDLVLHAYAAWGEGCLDRLTGDFAFAIWDENQRCLLCARDQFGAIPFYYARVGNSLVLGNTLQLLRLHPDVSDDLDDLFLVDFLCRIDDSRGVGTALKDARQLPAGHCLKWNEGSGEPGVELYYHMPEVDGYLNLKDPRDYGAGYREVLEKAVADRVTSAQVAVSMSGGLDSPLLAIMALRLPPADGQPVRVDAYTIVYDWLFPDDEGKYAGIVAEAHNLPIRYLEGGEHLRQKQAELVDWLSPGPGGMVMEPNANRMLLQEIAGGGRVMLTGLGGDPGLKPEPDHYPKLLKRFQFGQAWSEVRQSAKLRGRSTARQLRAEMRHLSGPPRFGPPSLGWLNPDLAGRFDLVTRWESQTRYAGRQNTREAMLCNSFWAGALSGRDPEVTGVPTRGRHPFFDMRVVDYLMRVPPVPWFVNKTLMREAARGLLPEPVRTRPKSPLGGFPLRDYVKKYGMPDWVEPLLVTCPGLDRYVKMDAVLERVRTPEKASDGDLRELRRTVTLAGWLHTYQRWQPEQL